MAEAESRELLEDLQASAPDVRLGLSRAGVRGLSKAIRLRWGELERLVAAEIDCTVDLDPAQKGVHMSRFPELFEEAIEAVVIGEALLVENLAEHIAAQIVDRQMALRDTLAAYPGLDDADFLFSRQVNLETIHTHDVIAERYGTVGELRAELDGTEPARHTELRDWLAG